MPKKYGYLGIDANQNNCTLETDLLIAGYPEEKQENNKKSLWKHNGRCKGID